MRNNFIKFRYFLILILLGFNSILLSGQIAPDLNFTNISTDDGLSNNCINDIIQDKLGFLWIATNDGLCRFESSKRLNIYKANHPDFPNGLKSSTISVLFEDSKNNLWRGTRMGGLTRLQRSNGELKTFTHDPSNPNSISNDEILCITEDKHGRIWVGTEDGFNVFDSETESFHTFKVNSDNPTCLNTKAVLSILEDDKGWIWVGTWGGGLHLLLPPESGSIENSHFKKIAPDQNKESLNIWKIYQDNQKRYWVGTLGGGIYLMQIPPLASNNKSYQNWLPQFHNYSANDNQSNSVVSNSIHEIVQDSHGNLWVGTKEGLNYVRFQDLPDINQYSYPTAKKPIISFSNFRYNPLDPKSLSSDNVQSIYEDSQGIIWIGTESGISKYNWATNQFDQRNLLKHFTHILNSENIYVDKKGTTWIAGGKKGLLKYNFKTDKIETFNNSGNTLLSNVVNSIYCPDDIHLYVGNDLGVSIFNMHTLTSTHFPTPQWLRDQFKNLNILKMFKDSENRIWIGTGHGLFLINEDGKYQSLMHDPNDLSSMSYNSITDIFEDSNGSVWVSTYNGLNRVKGSFQGSISFEHFKSNPKDPSKSIASNRLITMQESNGILYVGTTNGLSGYNLSTNEFFNFSKDNHKVFIHSISKTKNGDLWMSTNQGILFFNTKKRLFNSFQKKDGLEDIAFFSGSNCQDQDGFLYFGSRSGITRFHPDHIVSNTTPPPVYITDLVKMSPSKVTDINAILQDTLVLQHDEYYLSIK